MSNSTYIVTPAAECAPAPQGASTVSFLDYVREDLSAVEACMEADLGSDVRTLQNLSQHLLRAGGKRLRPAMVALSARAIDPNSSSPRIAMVGASIEFVHMATLVHDDVVDNTSMRRGKQTANAIYGNGVAVLSGDYLLARSMRRLALDGDLRIIRTVSEITIGMSEGEVMELSATGCLELPTAQYLEILRKKTAIFVEGCCRCGAILAGAPEPQETALADYGYRIGMAFQIADDLLDYTGDPELTGKPRGSDLRDGRATLPLLLTLGDCNARERQLLSKAFGKETLSEAEVDSVCAILERYQAFDRTRQAALNYLEEAEAALAILPESIARDCFTALTDYVIQRDR